MTSTEDLVQPFQLQRPNLRGRLVRLGPLLNEIIARHDYPLPVAWLLSETITAAVLLASLLKYDGVFTLQAKGAGAVSLLVCDVTSAGDVRAYAQFDAAHLPIDLGSEATFAHLLGAGYLAFTVDQGDQTERYQGIVAFEGETMSEALRHYFRQSEQLDTGIVLMSGHQNNQWQGGAIILQKMPEDEPEHITDRGNPDDWLRGMVLLGTCTKEELLDRALAPNDLLYRLFHEEEVRVFPPRPLHEKCRCSEERVKQMLQALPQEELDFLKSNGHVSVTCEFCNRTYIL